MKLLLDVNKAVHKEKRDKVELMAAGRSLHAQVEELKLRVREAAERERREGCELTEEAARRRSHAAEQQIEKLQQQLLAIKQEEEVVVSEMDVTGEALEEVQEQNVQLLQQIAQRDDVNFKLVAEGILSSHIHKLVAEERGEMEQQLITLKTQMDAQMRLERCLQHKEIVLEEMIAAVERELALDNQALEIHKHKTEEAAQLAAGLRRQLQRAQFKLRSQQTALVETRTAKEKESFNYKRAQEEISKLRRTEKQKEVEEFAKTDEVLLEELKEFKARLTCPCCGVRETDAVLTKCFHVFCFECVKARYDTRRRTCPKCNAAFGANDFHRFDIG